jgi:hypothetical protein
VIIYGMNGTDIPLDIGIDAYVHPDADQGMNCPAKNYRSDMMVRRPIAFNIA